MENTCNAIKDCILNAMQPYLDAESPQDERLIIPQADAIIVGVADLSRYNQKVVCAIVPGKTEESEGNIADAEEEHSITVSFMFTGKEYPRLVSGMFRYAEAFKAMLRDNPSMGRQVLSTTIGSTEYFPDAGSIEKQMTAAEIELTVRTHKEVTADDVFA